MRIGFISSGTPYPWGGSEVLWSQSAHRLLAGGHSVFASVPKWSEQPTAVQALHAAGAQIDERSLGPPPVAKRILGRILNNVPARRCDPRTTRRLVAFRPDLVCVSLAGSGLAYEWMLFLAENEISYVSVSQMNAEFLWPSDAHAQALLEVHTKALVNFFVSEANLRLFEAQLGARLANARIVRSPFQVPYDVDLGWPEEDGVCRFACIGRLDAKAKGQDLILEIVAREPWRSRDIAVSFFGDGENRATLERYAQILGVASKVRFRGHERDLTRIWREHQALLLPSRYEGLPLALVEAMLCARVPIVTAVGGNAEIVSDDETGFIAPAPTVPLMEATLERAWQRRHDWPRIGSAAQKRIRTLVPADPAADFADVLAELAGARGLHRLVASA